MRSSQALTSKYMPVLGCAHSCSMPTRLYTLRLLLLPKLTRLPRPWPCSTQLDVDATLSID
jgi:hypothetical protein